MTTKYSSLNWYINKNALACVVYYKLASAETWTQAETLSVTSYNLSETDKVLTQNFDALASYDLW